MRSSGSRRRPRSRVLRAKSPRGDAIARGSSGRSVAMLQEPLSHPITSRAPFGRRVAAMRATTGGRRWVDAGAVVVLAGAYYAAAKIGLRLAYLDGAVTALWPPVGVGIAALVLYGTRLWPGIVIGDLLVGDYSSPFGTVMGQTVGNTLEVVVAAVLLRRLTRRTPAMDQVGDVLALVAAGAAGTAISAAFGTASLRFGDIIPAGEVGEVARTWWLSDFSGALVVTPLLLTWASPTYARLGRREVLEGLALLAILVLLAEVPSQRDVPYVVFPVLIWAALRFGPRGAATAVLLAASLTVLNTAHNAGPFVRESITSSLHSTQLFLAAAALTSLVLAAVTAERGSADAALHANEDRLRAVVAEQTALRRIATSVAADSPPAALFAQVTEEVGRLLGAPNASVVRYEEDASATVVGSWTDSGAGGLPVGTRLPL